MPDMICLFSWLHKVHIRLVGFANLMNAYFINSGTLKMYLITYVYILNRCLKWENEPF